MVIRRKFYALVVIVMSVSWLAMYKLSDQHPNTELLRLDPLDAAALERLARNIESLQKRLPLSLNYIQTAENTEVQRAPSWVTSACGEPVSNIAFLKIHKCASTTVQNILLRYGDKHDLTFALPAKSHIFPLKKPFEASAVHQNASFHTDRVNIFAMHTKWNKKEISKILYPGAVYFTIVREPKSTFLSMYDYFAFTTVYKMNVSQFVMTHGIEAERFMGCLSYNVMACDFGAMPGDYSNPEAIVKLTQQMDEDFDLVMVAERMEESLVLLAHLLCWTYDDVVAVSSNTRSKKITSLSPEADTALSERLAPDFHIYNYFTKKLDMLIKAFGEDRMAQEVKKLRQATEAKLKGCNIVRRKSQSSSQKEQAGSSKVDKLEANSTDPDCYALVQEEQIFVARLKKKQAKLLGKH